jgi:hypothetical protein
VSSSNGYRDNAAPRAETESASKEQLIDAAAPNARALLLSRRALAASVREVTAREETYTRARHVVQRRIAAHADPPRHFLRRRVRLHFLDALKATPLAQARSHAGCRKKRCGTNSAPSGPSDASERSTKPVRDASRLHTPARRLRDSAPSDRNSARCAAGWVRYASGYTTPLATSHALTELASASDRTSRSALGFVAAISRCRP